MYKILEAFSITSLNIHPHSLNPSDHQEMYAVYLRHIFGEPGQGHIKQAPKSIGNVFTVLSSHFSQVC